MVMAYLHDMFLSAALVVIDLVVNEEGIDFSIMSANRDASRVCVVSLDGLVLGQETTYLYIVVGVTRDKKFTGYLDISRA